VPAARVPRTTLDEVAQLAGVSKATASKVLNRRPGASADTRRRVEDAVTQLDYAPTTTRVTRTGACVELLFDSLMNLYSLKVLEGLVRGAQDEGVELVTTALASGENGVGPRDLSAEAVRGVAARGRSGLLLVTTHVSAQVRAVCEELALPLVVIDPPNAVDPHVVSIGSDHFTGGLQATRHLLDLGHRRIAFVGGDPTNPGLRARYGGYREALEQAGLAEDPRLVSHAGMGSAEPVATRLLGGPDRPTAVFATNDGDAFGVIRAAHRLGLAVPEDLSVIGYDDTYASVPSAILLSTVHTPLHQLGRLAVSTLIGMAAGRPPVSHHVQLATHVVARETTGPVPEAARG
jgi:LacI family transcriptional regulator